MRALWCLAATVVLQASSGQTAVPTRPPIVATAIDGTPTALSATPKDRALIFTLAGLNTFVRVPLGKDHAKTDTRHSITVLATPVPQQLLVIHTFASAPHPLARCRAGEEMFMRLLDFAAAKPMQAWQLKIASCIDTLELSEAGGQWSAADQTLTINWLTGPGGKPETRRYKVSGSQVSLLD
jgi:hypothetical protein